MATPLPGPAAIRTAKSLYRFVSLPSPTALTTSTPTRYSTGTPRRVAAARAAPIPRSRPHRDTSDGFLQAHVSDLRAVQRSVHKITVRLRAGIARRVAGHRAIDVFTAPLIVRLANDVARLEGLLGTMIRTHRRSLAQARVSRSRWQEREGR